MQDSPNRIQEQHGSVTDRKATYPEGRGPLVEDVNAGTKIPENDPIVPSGSEAYPGSTRREAVWGELHFPGDAKLPDVDPRAIGDPIGGRRRPG